MSNKQLGRKRDDNPKDTTPTREEDQLPERPDRIPMFRTGGNSRLGVYSKFVKPDYEGYWFAEGERRQGRIQRALDAWWEPVINKDTGEKISYQSGSDMLYLMQLPKKYRNQDRLLKQQKVRARLNHEAAISENEYSPNNEEFAVKSEVHDRPM